jgi:purine nucleoside permease
MTASESLAHQRIGTYSAYLPSLEAAYRVGHTVVDALMRRWPDNPAPANRNSILSSK